MDRRPQMAYGGLGLLIGARGWDHEGWVGDFYPDDLPPDWRLSYYANAFRAALVPAEHLRQADPNQLGEWTADVPESFAFYLEVSGTLMQALGRGPMVLLELAQAIGDQLSGFVLDLASHPLPEAPQLERWLAGMLELGSVCARWRPESVPEHLLPTLQRHGVSLCWEPDLVQRGELSAGCVGRLDVGGGDVRKLREQVEAFLRWSAPCQQALLYFDGEPYAYQQMEEARVIAELLGG